LGPPCGFKGSKRSKKGELRCEKWGSDHTFAVPSQKKRVLEVIRRRLEGVVGGEFIKSFSGVDELWYRRRSLKVRNALRLHDVLDGVRVLNKGDDTHLRFTLGALPPSLKLRRTSKRGNLVDSLYLSAVVPTGTKADARGPTTSPKLLPIVALLFFRRSRGELSTLTSTPT